MMIASSLHRFFEARRIPGIIAVYLFGSQAENRAHRESDVDVGVLLDFGTYPTAISRSRLRLDVSGLLMEVSGKERVDVVILNDAPPELGRHIIVRGVRLFTADPDAVHDFERDIQLRAADIAPFLARMRRIKLEYLAQ